METQSNDNSKRENFDTEDSGQASQNEKTPTPDVSLDQRYDTNPNRNNFGTNETPLGLDDSPLDSAEWKKNDEEEYASNEGREHRKEALDNQSEDSKETDSISRDERNVSFDRDL